MATRTTQVELEKILPNPESYDLTPFIDAASRLVTARLGSSGLTAAQLGDVELFLAAHIATALLRREKREIIGEAEVEYQPGDLGKFLESTEYGQTALALDTSGLLAKTGQTSILFSAIAYSGTGGGNAGDRNSAS